MDAIEFVKKFGTKEAEDQLENPKLVYGAQVDYQFMNDLKQIVDSWLLVEGYGGLKSAIYMRNHNMLLPEFKDELKQAINIVEKYNER